MGIFNLEIMGDTGLLLLYIHLPKPCASVFSCTDECLGAERNRTHFYCIPKNRKYHFIGLFFIRLGAVQLTAADASVNICKGGTFRELAAADYCAQQAEPMAIDPMFCISVFISFLFQCSCIFFSLAQRWAVPAARLGELQPTVSPALGGLEALRGECAVAGIIPFLGEAVMSLLSHVITCTLGHSRDDSPPAPKEGRWTFHAPDAIRLASEKLGAMGAP